MEAWLLSEPDILPREVSRELPRKEPEAVNFSEPPSKLLERLYRSRLNRHYKKVTDGARLFGKLDPSKAYVACPALAEVLDTMLYLARDARADSP